MDDASLDRQELIRLLRKLKEETPEYPPDLLEARKYSYLKQVVDLQMSKNGPPGGGSAAGGSGRPGGALGGGATFLGLPLKMLLAIGAAIVLLAAGVFFREEVTGFLAENGVIATEQAAPPAFDPRPGGQEQATPAPGAPAAGGVTQPAPGPGEGAGPEAPAAPTESGPATVFDYLICILQSGPQTCR